jgi:hypothetical protein
MPRTGPGPHLTATTAAAAAQDFSHAFQNMVLDRIRAAAAPLPPKQTSPVLTARARPAAGAAAARWPACAAWSPSSAAAPCATPPPFEQAALRDSLNRAAPPARQASAGRAAGRA